jgi:hypothetical protein
MLALQRKAFRAKIGSREEISENEGQHARMNSDLCIGLCIGTADDQFLFDMKEEEKKQKTI